MPERCPRIDCNPPTINEPLHRGSAKPSQIALGRRPEIDDIAHSSDGAQADVI